MNFTQSLPENRREQLPIHFMKLALSDTKTRKSKNKTNNKQRTNINTYINIDTILNKILAYTFQQYTL